MTNENYYSEMIQFFLNRIYARSKNDFRAHKMIFEEFSAGYKPPIVYLPIFRFYVVSNWWLFNMLSAAVRFFYHHYLWQK